MERSLELLSALSRCGVKCSTEVRGAEKTSFKIGGRLGVFAEPISAVQLCSAIKLAREFACRYYVIGNGSNLLLADEGVDALFIRPSGRLTTYKIDGCRIKAYAGASLASVAKASVKAGLMGFEWASGIPGTIGGAVAMNAGAYGGEIKDVITRVALERDGGVEWTAVKEGDLGYRSSVFAFPNEVVIATEFELAPDDGHAAERMNEYNEKRRQKQPVELPSAGSAFKRPEGHFAAALIDEAGLKGRSVGGACVSPKHAGFIVNNGGATCRDVLELMRIVHDEVFKKFGVELEPEVRIID